MFRERKRALLDSIVLQTASEVFVLTPGGNVKTDSVRMEHYAAKPAADEAGDSGIETDA